MALVRIDTGCCTAQDAALLAAACGNEDYDSLYIVPRNPQEAMIDGLEQIYDVVSRTRPMMNVIPLFEWAGWTLSRVAEMEDLETMMTVEDVCEVDETFLRRLNSLRGRENLPSVTMENVEIDPDSVDVDALSGEAMEEKEFAFDQVVVGGTYDHLHAGHRLLLAVSALVSRQKLVIGITDEHYLDGKANRDRIQSLEERTRNVLQFVRGVRPELKVSTSILTDPKDPVLAELQPEFEALVVSKETQTGGEKVNASREDRGFAPLKLVVVGLVGVSADGKLSSSVLRQA